MVQNTAGRQILDDFPLLGEDFNDSFLFPDRSFKKQRQTVDVMRAEDQIDLRIFFQDLVHGLFFLRHAAGHRQQQIRIAALKVLEEAEFTEDLLFRVLTDRAGVDQDQIRFRGIFGRCIAHVLQDAGHRFRVTLVRLAAVGADIVFLSAAKSLQFLREHEKIVFNDNFPGTVRRLAQ